MKVPDVDYRQWTLSHNRQNTLSRGLHHYGRILPYQHHHYLVILELDSPSSVTSSSNSPSATTYASSSLWNRRMTQPPYNEIRSSHSDYQLHKNDLRSAAINFKWIMRYLKLSERHRLYQKQPGSCSSHLLNLARDRNMQIRRDPYSLESTRLDPQNRGFTRVARGEQPISERLGINKYGVKWKVIAFVD